MSEVLLAAYLWVKALHIISAIAWMAGLFYLPRLFVYHAEMGGDRARGEMLELMETRLLRVIMNPAMAATWTFGVLLALTPGAVDWSASWPYVKFAAVLAMTWFHGWLAVRHRDFAAGANAVTGRQYRIMNEIPTVLLVLIVFSVIFRF